MAKEAAPAFQYYPKDYLSDVKVRAMSYKERGIYWELVSLVWCEKVLPADPVLLARILGLPVKEFKRHWTAIAPCFRAVNDGLEHGRLEQERRNQQRFRTEQSESGKRGAEKRWAKKGDGVPMATPLVENGDPMILPMAKHGSSSAISHLRSASAERDTKNVSLSQREGAIVERRNARIQNQGDPMPLWDWQFAKFRDALKPKFGAEAWDKTMKWVHAVGDELNARGEPVDASDPVKWWDARYAADWTAGGVDDLAAFKALGKAAV